MFNIYKPSKGFVWTRSRIILAFLLVDILILLLIYTSGIKKDMVSRFFGWFTILPFVAYFINMWFPEQLKGKLEGKLIFEIEKITIDNIVYPIEELKYIEIIQNDYKGKYIDRNAFDGMFSQVCNNKLKIRLLNNQEKHCLFQREYPRELLYISDQLNYYIEKGLLTKEARNSILN